MAGCSRVVNPVFQVFPTVGLQQLQPELPLSLPLPPYAPYSNPEAYPFLQVYVSHDHAYFTQRPLTSICTQLDKITSRRPNTRRTHASAQWLLQSTEY